MKEETTNESVQPVTSSEQVKKDSAKICHDEQAKQVTYAACDCHKEPDRCKCHETAHTQPMCECASHHTHDAHHHCGCGCCHTGGTPEGYHVHEGISIQFEGEFPCDSTTLWAYLTDNDLLQQWYPELAFESLQPGGTLVYRYQDGGYETMMVMDVEPNVLLSYTWDTNTVSFELQTQEPHATGLVFTEWISQVTDFTPKDLTAWLVGLQRLALLLEQQDLGDWEAMFEKYLPQVEQLLEQETAEFE